MLVDTPASRQGRLSRSLMGNFHPHVWLTKGTELFKIYVVVNFREVRNESIWCVTQQQRKQDEEEQEHTAHGIYIHFSTEGQQVKHRRASEYTLILYEACVPHMAKVQTSDVVRNDSFLLIGSLHY